MSGHRPVVDVHHHAFAPALRHALATAGVDGAGGESLPPWSPEDSLRIMDRYGIDVAMLSVPVPLTFADDADRRRLARAVNEFGADCARRWPDRFGFLATLPLPDVEGSVAEARHAFDTLGADGVAVLTKPRGDVPGRSAPRAPVCRARPPRGRGLHPPHRGRRRPHARPRRRLARARPPAVAARVAFDTTRAVANLIVTDAVERYPGIRFVVTHCGGCTASVASRLIDRRPLVEAYTNAMSHGAGLRMAEVEAMMVEAQQVARRRLASLFFDVALSTDPGALAALVGLVPWSQLVLGTDFPIAQEIGLHVTLESLERRRS